MSGNGKVNKNLSARNLKKGNVDGRTVRVSEAMSKPKKIPPGNPGGNIGAVQAARARDAQIRELGISDPEKVQEELYSEMALQMLRLTRKLNRSGGEPSRMILEGWRELRQAGLVVLEIRQSRGSLAEAADFFDEMGSRVATGLSSGAFEGVFPLTATEPEPDGSDA